MTMLIATFVLTALGAGNAHSPKSPATTIEARVAQAFVDAEDDLEVRRSQLGLLGSALFLGEIARPPACPDSMPAESRPSETRTGSRP
jgi:hypothetical protein